MSGIVVLVKRTDMPREMHDRQKDFVLAALAEAGHPAPEPYWAGEFYRWKGVVAPDDVLHRAQRLSCLSLGIPFREADA